MARDLGVAILGISPKEWHEAVAEVTEDLFEIRQEAYDLIIDMMGEVVTPENRNAILSQLTDQGFAQLAAERPQDATDLLREVRKGLE